MDRTVYPGSLIERLPRALQAPAGALKRGLAPLRPASGPGYVYHADGLATAHYSPFLHDAMFSQAYDTMVEDWYRGTRVDVRWRMWLLTALARECRALDGNVAEFGVYRGGCAYMLLSLAAIPPSGRLFLFDTFAGIPSTNLRDEEASLAGKLTDTSTEHVRTRLAAWSASVEIVAGDVFDTLPPTETGPLAFVHVDLNATAATIAALEYAYARLLPGAVVVFDDYGSDAFTQQRLAIDAFFDGRSETVVAVPTGQGILLKR